MKLKISVSSSTGNMLSKSSAESEFWSAHALGDRVQLILQGHRLDAEVLGVAFMQGKVLYTLMVYTGNFYKDNCGQWGIMNTIGWDDRGREYIRIPNIDSTLVSGVDKPVVQNGNAFARIRDMISREVALR